MYKYHLRRLSVNRRERSLQVFQRVGDQAIHVAPADLTIAGDPRIELRASDQDLAPNAIVGEGVRGIRQVVPELPGPET
jgi:hypothetical protein